jgi:glutaminase
MSNISLGGAQRSSLPRQFPVVSKGISSSDVKNSFNPAKTTGTQEGAGSVEHRNPEIQITKNPDGGYVASHHDKLIGKMRVKGIQTDFALLEAQKEVFDMACTAYLAVKSNQQKDQHPTEIINAQYINALKETVTFSDQSILTVEKSPDGKSLQLVYAKQSGSKDITNVPADVTSEQAINHFAKENNLDLEKSVRSNSSNSLGFTIETQFAKISVGDVGEEASIQSVSKVFADLALLMCEGGHYVENDSRKKSVMIVTNDSAHPDPLNYTRLEAENHAVSVESKKSPFAFNNRGNLEKHREASSTYKAKDPEWQRIDTTYSIYNASNNYGALTTTGRIPNKVNIDGEVIEGRENIVRTIMEMLLSRKIGINTPVLKGELDDTNVDHDNFPVNYRNKYLPVKDALSGSNAFDWSKINEMDRDKVADLGDVEKSLHAILQVAKVGKFGNTLRDCANEGRWKEFKETLRRHKDEHTEIHFRMLDEVKINFPDNFTRTLWLALKGAYGADSIEAVKKLKNATIKQQSAATEAAEIVEVEKEAKQIMEAYTTHCAFNVTCDDLATLMYAIASGGVNSEGKRIFSEEFAQHLEKQILFGGMYNQALDPLVLGGTVAQAAKSGVGGFIGVVMNPSSIDLLAEERQDFRGFLADQRQEAIKRLFGTGASAAVFSRPLNPAGNSADGVELLRKFSDACFEFFKSYAKEK